MTTPTQISPGTLLNQRYRIVKPLGRGGVGFTFGATDLQTQKPVAIKMLSLKRADDWKKIELFEREAHVLSQLNHPAIPSYIDYFQEDTVGDRSFYIVQQLAPGRSLDQWIASNWTPSPNTLEKIATKLLKILIYLQSLMPPVIHRDIKPQNIIVHKSGQLFLVDFGSVQDTYRQTITQGSTVVGTFGYMAPEQFRGHAVPATDLYGLGATLLFLLIGDSPATLPQRHLRIQFRSALPTIDPFLADWLERLLEPRADHRISTAQEALNMLMRQQPLSPLPQPVNPQVKPLDSPIRLTEESDTLSIQIPPIGLRTAQIQRIALINLLFNGFLVFVVLMMVSLQFFLDPTKQIGFLGFCVAGLFLFVKSIYGAFTVTRLTLVRDSQSDSGIMLKLDQWLLGSRYKKVRSPLSTQTTMQLKHHKLWPWTKTPFTYCALAIGRKRHEFGGFLTVAENQWLCKVINTFLDDQR